MTLVEQVLKFIRQAEGQIDPEELAGVLAAEASVENERDIPPRLPLEATRHPPGSAAKIAVMAERASRGESLFHPEDRAAGTAASPRKEDTSVRLPKVRKLVLPGGATPTEETGYGNDWTG